LDIIQKPKHEVIAKCPGTISLAIQMLAAEIIESIIRHAAAWDSLQPMRPKASWLLDWLD